MTNEEIFKKAIEQAVKNNPMLYGGMSGFCLASEALGIKKNEKGEIVDFGFPFYYHFIFSHDFAMSFWGEKKHNWEYPLIKSFRIPYCKNCKIKPSMDETTYCWQYHLQQMVLKKNPLIYLKKFLD